VRAGGKHGHGEPDPGHFERFFNVVVPDLLTGVCHVSTELAVQIREDILARAQSYAELGDTARDVLTAPFAEEVARYEPVGSPLALKGAVAVVVRSSLLEEAHSHGPVEAGGIQGITAMAAAPLSHLLASRHRNPVTVEHNLFAGLAVSALTLFPRGFDQVIPQVLAVFLFYLPLVFPVGTTREGLLFGR